MMIAYSSCLGRSLMPFKYLLLLGILMACNRVSKNGDAARTVEKPNILFAFADDWGKYASCYQGIDGPRSINALFNTPNVDRIANEGILFKHAFVNAPSCTPCRSSLLSGQHFFRTGRGAILQGAEWDESIPTFPLLLHNSGYHIGYTYKVWSPGKPPDAGYGGVKNRFQRAAQFNNFSQHVAKFMDEDGKSLEEAKGVLYEEVRNNFQDFLDAREHDQPFCYWWGPTNVHRKWIYGSGERFWNLDPEKLKGKMPSFLPDVDTVRTDFADYLGEIMAFDAGLGLLLSILEDRGELDNTLIVVSGDHGFPGMTNGKCNLYDFGVQVPLVARWPGVIGSRRKVEDFVSLPDLAPTFLEAAGVALPKEMTSRSLMGIFRSGNNGQIEDDRDYVITGRERHVRMARAGALPYPQRAIRTKEFLYIINFEPDRYPMGDPLGVDDNNYVPDINELTNNTFHAFGDYDASPSKAWIVAHRREPDNKKYFQFAFGKRPAEELFEIRTDSDQVINLAGDPQYEEVRKKLRNQLMDVLSGTGDPRVISDVIPYEHPPFAGEEE